jgi:hypothetical protein
VNGQECQVYRKFPPGNDFRSWIKNQLLKIKFGLLLKINSTPKSNIQGRSGLVIVRPNSSRVVDVGIPEML